MRRWLLALVALGFPSPVLACAACAAAVDRSNAAFIGITVLLSLLPLAMIGGGLLWIARHARERLAGEFEERDSLAGTSGQVAMADDATTSPGGAGALLVTPGAGEQG